MGNCLGTDVKAKYAVGRAEHQDSLFQAEAEAKELVTGALSYCSWLVLHLECRELKDVDLLSKSDAIAILYSKEDVDGRWMEHGRTEMVANSLSPKFVQTFKVLYNFERIQRYKVVVVDVDKGQDPRTVDPEHCKPLGFSEFVLSEVVTAPGKRLVRSLERREGRNTRSLLVLTAEEASNCKETYRITMSATNLKNVERFGTSDPFLQISRRQEDGEYVPVFKTEVAKNTLKPLWREIAVRGTQLNNGDLVRPLRLEVFDYNASGSHVLMGYCDVTTERLQELARQPGALLELHPPHGKPSGDYGALQVKSFTVHTSSSFLDYLAGGAEVGFVVAVDFTASNGEPTRPTSKHYFAGGPTQYERAVMGVGHVLEYYDHDKVFPMYGFGGQYERNPVNHCFPMSAAPDSSCVGVNGLLQAYRHALSTWKLSGPTLFAPVIRMASNMARATLGSMPPKYTVLLILTDGAIMDMEDTTSAIIEASTLPLSILVVGIGRENFGPMHMLDSDGEPLRVGNRTARRDIVQFVEFEKYAGDGTRLAQELLGELPGQFVEYMRLFNVPCPQPRLAAPTMTGYAAPPAPPAVVAPSAPPLL